MMFAYSTSFHRAIKTFPFELTFGIEPRTMVNPSPDLRLEYGEDFGKELFQRMKFCQKTAKDVSRSHNDEAIKKSVNYFNSKVKPITFAEETWCY